MKKFSLAVLGLTLALVTSLFWGTSSETQQAKQLPNWDKDKQETHADL